MLIIALILAFILNSGLIRYQNFFKTLYFTPMVTSSVAVAFVFMTIYGVPLRADQLFPASRWTAGH